MARVAVTFDGVTRGVRGAANETRAEIRKVRQESDQANKSASLFGNTLRTALKAGAAAAGGGLLAMAGAVAFTGIRFDNLKQKAEIAFTTMLGSGEKARSFLGELQKFAAATPFEFPDLIRASQRMLAMGIASKDILPSLTAIGDAVGALGGGAAEIDRVTLAIGQMGLKGRAQAEEMLQLTESGINGWKYLARALNVDVARAQEMVTKRMVDGRFAQRAILAGMEADFHGSMEKQSHTFGGLWSTIKDTFTQVSGTVMQPFFNLAVKGMQRLVDITGTPEFTAGVQRFAQRLADEAVPAIHNSIGWLVNHKEDILDVMRGIRDVGIQAAKTIGAIATNADKVAKALGGWDDVVKGAAFVLVLSRLATVAARVRLIGTAALLARTRLIALFAVHKSGIREGLQDEKAARQGGLGGAALGGLTRGAIGGPGGMVQGHTGQITAGLGALEGALGATVYNDFATSGHSKHSHHYRGDAADLAPDPKVWARLFARKEMFAELLGPWGLYNWGVQFYNAELQKDHMDHIHVAYTGGSDAIKKAFGIGGGSVLGPGAVPISDTTAATTGADIDVGANVAGAGTTKATTKKATTLTGAALLTQRTRKLLAGADTRGEQLAAYQAVEKDLEDDLKTAHGKQRNVIEVELEKTRKKIRELEAAASADRTARLRESTKKAMDVWKAHLDEMHKRVEVAQSALSEAFGKLAQRGLAEFDKQTKAKVDALEAERQILTPKEKELAELLAGRAQKARDAAIAGARSDLEKAQAEGDPDKVASAQKALDDALFEQAQFDLETAAAAERAQRDKEYADKRQSLEDERALERDHFEEQLKQLEEFLGNRNKSIDEANARLIAIFKQFGIDLGAVDIAPATTAVAGLRGEQAREGDAVVGPGLTISGGIATVGTGAGAVNIPKEWLGFQHGGRVPGRYVGREDTVMMRATPGERVLTAEQQEWLERAGGGGGPTINLNNPTFFGATEREVMQGLARAIDPYLKRRVGFDRI